MWGILWGLLGVLAGLSVLIGVSALRVAASYDEKMEQAEKRCRESLRAAKPGSDSGPRASI